MILARTLSVEAFGVLNVGIALAGIAFMATGLGLPEVGSREASVHPGGASRTAAQVLGGRLLALAPVALTGLVIAAVAFPESLAVAALAAAMAVALSLSVDWLLRGLDRMGAVAAANAAGGALVLAGAGVVALAGGDVEAALLVFVAGEALVAAITLAAAGRARPRGLTLDGVRGMLRSSWPLGASALIVYSYYANLDTILLSALRSTAEAGLYSAPYRLFLAANVIGTFAAYALLPRLSRAVAAGADEDAAAMERVAAALPKLAAFGLLMLGAAEIAGDDILGLLFGDRYAGEGATFVLLCAAIPWYTVGFPVGYGLIARDENRRFLRGAAVAGSLSLALDLALIPWMGTEGAAVATAVALIAASLLWLSAHGLLGGRTLPIVAVLAAAAVGAAAVALEGTLGIAVGAATVLAAAVLALRPPAP